MQRSPELSWLLDRYLANFRVFRAVFHVFFGRLVGFNICQFPQILPLACEGSCWGKKFDIRNARKGPVFQHRTRQISTQVRLHLFHILPKPMPKKKRNDFFSKTTPLIYLGDEKRGKKTKQNTAEGNHLRLFSKRRCLSRWEVNSFK